MIISIEESGLYIDILANTGEPARLLNLSNAPLANIQKEDNRRRLLVEAHLSGENLDAHHARKHNGSSLGLKLNYVSHSISGIPGGKCLEVVQEYNGIQVKSRYTLYRGVPCVRVAACITNNSEREITLEYISSLMVYALPIEKWEDDAYVYIPHNSWTTECNWKCSRVRDLGLFNGGDFSLKRIACENIGSWSTVEYLPMGMLYDKVKNRTAFWQIEHNGSWEWEIGECDKSLYLGLFGPTPEQGDFYKIIKPGETFCSVPAAFGMAAGSAESAVQALTAYRRKIRRRDRDNEELPVIYNDFIALGSSPSTEKDMPLVDAAAELDCDVFCIDAGWYDTGNWWDRVGEWQVCEERFPGGLKELTDYIEKKDMIPGIWLEPEVMGIACPMAENLPDDWFFCRRGKRVIDNARYMLDFSNPDVCRHIDGVIDGLIRDYRIGYLKLDYNIDAGVGTECHSDSYGDGLLRHNRAYLKWAEKLLERHPALIVESCASGGCRMDYGMLSVFSMQSVSDQADYRKVARISAMYATAITPEQAGIWSAPNDPDDTELAAFHMINTMLARVHQSGKINDLSPESKEIIHEGILIYKNEIRSHLPDSLPIWPNGFVSSDTDSFCYGLINKNDRCGYLAAWNLTGTEPLKADLSPYGIKEVLPLYPEGLPFDFLFKNDALTVSFKEKYTARLFKLLLK